MRREREWWRWIIIDIKCAILLQIKQSKNNRNCNCKIIRFYLWWKLCLHKRIVAAIVFYGNWGELKICKNAERKQLILVNIWITIFCIELCTSMFVFLLPNLVNTEDYFDSFDGKKKWNLFCHHGLSKESLALR